MVDIGGAREAVPTTVDLPRPLLAVPDPRRADVWHAEVGGRAVRLTNLAKPYWGPEGFTKGDLVAYYANIAPHALPYVRDRPLTMKRMPAGADGEFFYMKQVPEHAPAWVATAGVRSLDTPKVIDYVLAQEAATLVWMANLGCIELHPWHARVDDLGRPDYAFFDLDPVDVDFEVVRDVALLVRDACEHLGLRSYPRTSGATGMQIYVPIDRVHTAAAVTDFVGRVCTMINRADPQRTTMVWQVADRPAAVFLDHRMNTEGRNIAGTYSLRPRRGATVATPLTWDEVEGGALPQDFTIATIWSRLDAVGDLLAPILRGGQDLRAAMRAVGMDPDEQGGPSHEVVRAPARPAVARPAPRGRATPAVSTPPPAGRDAPPDDDGVLPAAVAPMLATAASEPFDDPGWVFEVKWDGVRAVTAVGARSHRMTSRQGNDLTGGYPELAGLPARIDARSAVLDGEIVAFTPDGRPSFQRLQSRMHLRGEADVARASRAVPVAYVVFDLLAVDGEPLVDRPLVERLERLDAILDPAAWLRRSDRFVEDGRALFAAAEQRGLEGIMAKRLTSRYRPGARSADWRKIKVRRTAGVVVGGWLGGAGGRSGDLGALLVGWWDGAGPPRYAGRVGTGFDGAERRRLLDRLGGLDASSRPTLADAPRLPDARWVAPRLVCRVEYGEITEAGRLRAPSYKGLLDVDPAACTRPGDVG